MKPTPSPRSRTRRSGPRLPGRIPAGVWVLGFGSLFMDASSELIHSLLPLYMVSALGASVGMVGLIEGIAEATAQITKVFSGTLSDRFRRRKFPLVLGYAMAALTKPVFPLASSLGWIMAARFADRVGKGIRGAPRDALVADLTPPELRGAAYGLRQGLDSIGAFLGPVLAIACMAWFAGNIKACMWVGVAPALITVGLLAFGIREPRREPSPAGNADRQAESGRVKAGERAQAGRRMPFGLDRLGARLWLIVALGSVFSLARISEAFLVLRAQSVGLPLGRAPIVMILMNVVYALGAYPAGAAADRWSNRTLLVLGLLILIGADLALAAAGSPALVFAGALLWGLHMALTQGLFSKLVAGACPPDLRGTGFGVFNLCAGLSLLAASSAAGALWDRFGPPAAFLGGAMCAALCAAGLLAYRPKTP
jgi:MFS family permease